jgi:hypothetical protein
VAENCTTFGRGTACHDCRRFTVPAVPTPDPLAVLSSGWGPRPVPNRATYPLQGIWRLPLSAKLS